MFVHECMSLFLCILYHMNLQFELRVHSLSKITFCKYHVVPVRDDKWLCVSKGTLQNN